MKGPFSYFERRVLQEDSLAKVLASDDQLMVRAVRSIGGLMIAGFATLTFFAVDQAIEHAEGAYRANDNVIAGAEAFAAAGDAAAGVLTGWVVLEAGSFVMNATQRIRELDNV